MVLGGEHPAARNEMTVRSVRTNPAWTGETQPNDWEFLRIVRERLKMKFLHAALVSTAPFDHVLLRLAPS